MQLITASAVISFHGKLEDQALRFYDDLARNERYAKVKETFQAFAKENQKHKEIVLRVYREIITDAFEACFSFDPPLNETDYSVNTELTEDANYVDALRTAIEVEENAYEFCTDVGEKSSRLLADLARAFQRVGKSKAKRKLTLESLLNKATANQSSHQ